MFIRIDKKYLKEYSKNDYLLPYILKEKEVIDESILRTRLHQFNNMIKYEWKRAMFDTLYGDLEGKKILDIGGAYCGYKKLLELNDYTLVEPDETFSILNTNVFSGTWEEFKPGYYDVVIACDIFLTNSFAIDKFLEKYLTITKELRFSLTFRNVGKDRWTLEELNNLLHKYNITKKMYYKDIGLPGKRNIYLISLKGNL